MKDLLAALDSDTDFSKNPEFCREVHAVCANYIGGAWKDAPSDQLVLSRITNAMSNILFICMLPDEYRSQNGVPTKLLLRVNFNPDNETSLLTDTIVFALLAERGIGPKLYGIFEDGRLEEYIESRPLITDELAIPKISSEIARKLARIHQLNVPISKKPDYLTCAMERWLKRLRQEVGPNHKFQISERFWDHFPKELACDEIAKELDHVSGFLNENKSKVVFAHNDLQEGNILLPVDNANSTDLGLIFIDFEYSSYNYRGFDLANHFVEYSIRYDLEHPPYYKVMDDKFPDRTKMLQFLTDYLTEIMPNASERELNSEADKLLNETMQFVPVSYFFWAVWAFLQAVTSPLEFGFAEHAQDRLYSYFKTRSFMQQQR